MLLLSFFVWLGLDWFTHILLPYNLFVLFVALLLLKDVSIRLTVSPLLSEDMNNLLSFAFFYSFDRVLYNLVQSDVSWCNCDNHMRIFIVHIMCVASTIFIYLHFILCVAWLPRISFVYMYPISINVGTIGMHETTMLIIFLIITYCLCCMFFICTSTTSFSYRIFWMNGLKSWFNFFSSSVFHWL